MVSCDVVERRAQRKPPLVQRQDREPGDQAEVDGERLAVSQPDVSSERGHSDPSDPAVDRDGEREHPRVGGVRVRELHRCETEEEERRRPATEPVRVGERRFPVECRAAPAPRDEVGRGAPRTEPGPDVPEQDRERNEADPEEHQDERRGEVRSDGTLADERRHEDDHEETEPQRAQQDAKRTGGNPKERAQPLMLEDRSPPERTERGEGQHQHGGGAVVRQPLRDRRVLHAGDPVREREQQRHGRTVSCAICLPRPSSSISKRPVRLALS